MKSGDMILPHQASTNTAAYDLAECVGKFRTTGITAVEDTNGVKCLLCIPSLSKTSGHDRYLIPLWPPPWSHYIISYFLSILVGRGFYLRDGVWNKNLWNSISTDQTQDHRGRRGSLLEDPTDIKVPGTRTVKFTQEPWFFEFYLFT